MKVFLVLGLLASTLCLQTRLNIHQAEDEEVPITGGYNKRQPNSQDKRIDDFIKNQLPQLQDAKLTQVQVQVVNGWNYKFKYTKDQKSWVVTVYEGIDEKNLQLMGIVKEVKGQDEDGNIKIVKQSLKKQDKGVIEAGRNLF